MFDNVTPIVPNVNINGTSKEELRKQYLEIFKACHVLNEALSKAIPHGRDYFDGKELEQARSRMYDHKKYVNDIADYYTAVCLGMNKDD